MSCVNTASFFVLVNGSPSTFFKGSRGIRQGCPLSPYLFMLIIEGLSLLPNQAKKDKRIKGVKVSGTIHITHTLFVDDVIIFGSGSVVEWHIIKELSNLFCLASGMTFSISKSCFRHCRLNDSSLQDITQLFSIYSKHLDDGITYLGFFLGPNHYQCSDWD